MENLKSGKDYELWADMMMRIFRMSGIAAIVKGEEKRPSMVAEDAIEASNNVAGTCIKSNELEKATETWDVKDQFASLLIKVNVSQHIQNQILYTKTAHEAWQRLKLRYHRDTSMLFNL